jgi:hypothetical protein
MKTARGKSVKVLLTILLHRLSGALIEFGSWWNRPGKARVPSSAPERHGLKRSPVTIPALCATLLGALLAASPAVEGQGGGGAVASDPELDAELRAFLAELEAPRFTDDPFAEGRVPDLVVLSSADVQGEVAPCG